MNSQAARSESTQEVRCRDEQARPANQGEQAGQDGECGHASHGVREPIAQPVQWLGHGLNRVALRRHLALSLCVFVEALAHGNVVRLAALLSQGHVANRFLDARPVSFGERATDRIHSWLRGGSLLAVELPVLSRRGARYDVGLALFHEPTPALRREHVIERFRGLRVVGEQEVRVFEFVRRLHFTRKQEVRRQHAILGARCHGRVHRGGPENRGNRVPLFIRGRDREIDRAAGGERGSGTSRSREVQQFAGLAEDESLRHGNQVRVLVRRFLEDRDSGDAATGIGLRQKCNDGGRAGLHGDLLRVRDLSARIGSDYEVAILADRVNAEADRLAGRRDRVQGRERDSVVLRLRQFEARCDPGRVQTLEAEAIRRIGLRREGEGAQPAVGTGMFVGDGIDLGDDLVAQGDGAANIDGLPVRIRAANVDAVGHAGDQLAAFGEELDDRFRARDRHPLGHRFVRAIVAERHHELHVAARHVRPQ